jgi:hypothetical protein
MPEKMLMTPLPLQGACPGTTRARWGAITLFKEIHA